MGSLSVSISFYCVLLGVFELSVVESSFKLAWVERPPYSITHPGNHSENEARGILFDILRTKLHYCGQFETVRVNYENDIMEKLVSGEVQLGGPIIAKGMDLDEYKRLPFLAILEYPGADFITKAKPKEFGKAVTMAILSSWPLLAFTLIMTAIAGIITWALDTVMNPEEFPRSFLRGSWEGVWWSFISMTTVGYGDKSPKSIPSRIFAMIWIQVGLIVMAVLMAVITSALTSMSLEPDTRDIHGSKVGVLGNGTEYQLARKAVAKPKVFDTFTNMMNAWDSEEVTGILVDRISGYYYLSQDNHSNRSLVTSDHIPLTASLGLAASSMKRYINMTSCLQYMKNYIRQEALAIISIYSAPKKKRIKAINVFDISYASPLRKMLYISMATLTVMLLAGVMWDLLCRKKTATKIAKSSGIDNNTEMIHEKQNHSASEELRRDLDQGKRMLRQLHEYFEMLERKSLERVY